MSFFPGFVLERLELADGPIRVRRGGAGPALLLLHGNPQTHAMWHAVAPVLARRFSVICPDLPGYGGSVGRNAAARGAVSSAGIAAEMVALMDRLGHGRFHIGAHDRGARIAHRLALDFPERVGRLALLDVVPALEQFERADMSSALAAYETFWFAQPHPKPESLIVDPPEAWFRAEAGAADFFHPEALADYLAAARGGELIGALHDGYRASVTTDVALDRMSRAENRRIESPLLVLWGMRGRIGGWYDPLALWRGYASGEVIGGPVPAGHFLAEEAPAAVLAWWERFF